VSALETVLSTAAGVAMISLAGRDIFDALFHPEGRGTLARILSRALWSLFRRAARGSERLFPVAGPVTLIAVIATWALLLVVGWALIFWPHVPEGFRFDPGAGERHAGFLDALSFSLVTLTTLGFGDMTPKADWLRVVAPIEALLGFGLLSASISWLLLIYPVLARRRSLAYEVALLREEERRTGKPLQELDPAAAERLYAELTSRLIAVERDLVNFPITYYFASADARFSLAAAAPYLLDLADRGAAAPGVEPLGFRARLLREAVDDFARTTATRFHGVEADSTAAILRAYARDHLRGD
jgi:voltage-gated potassium channel Kch